MRKTNCKRMKKVMSLYIAADLVGEPEREAASHLATCDGCRQLASEFAEGNSLLTQACAQPDFGGEFYAGIRSAVLKEISHYRVPSKPSIFGRRWLYAASLAAAIIASGVMLQYRRSAPETPQGLASNSPVIDRPTLGRAKGADPSSSPQLLESPRWPRRSRRPAVVRKPDTLNPTGTARDDRKEIAPAIGALTASGASASESATLSGQSASSSSGAASSSEVSRIEIQTADANIRIIWLSPRDSRKSEESNHDQDPENGDRN